MYVYYCTETYYIMYYILWICVCLSRYTREIVFADVHWIVLPIITRIVNRHEILDIKKKKKKLLYDIILRFLWKIHTWYEYIMYTHHAISPCKTFAVRLDRFPPSRILLKIYKKETIVAFICSSMDQMFAYTPPDLV